MSMSLAQSDDLSLEQLAEDYLQRRRAGHRPSVEEYQKKYPHLAEKIAEFFPALCLVEEFKPEVGGNGTETPPTEPKIPFDRLGDFHILREVGRGGMGVVYEAEQLSLGRRVALKVLLKHQFADARLKGRFEREARAVAKLHHTNIVPIFGAGEQEGVHYYVMQFIHGLGLDEVLIELQRLREESASPNVTAEQQVAALGRNASALCVAQSLLSGRLEPTRVIDDGNPSSDFSDEQMGLVESEIPLPNSEFAGSPSTTVGRLSDTFHFPGHSEHTGKHHSRHIYWQSVARIGVQAAEALQYAHSQGVIHRDIKPGNLLLDTHGCVWVTDFGLAKAADQKDLTHTGDVLGTLRYMSPEQFDGKADRRSDVYSLGLTLYEMLAVRPAFNEKDRHKLIKQVTNETPPRLRTIDPHIPRDLETIVHKAIDRDPSHRYQSAGELAADLERFLGNEPIRAKWVSPTTRFTRWCKRNPAGASAVALLVLCLCGSILSAALIADERNKTEDALSESEGKTRQLQAQNDALERERRRVDEQRRRAEKEKQRAEENHRRAREAVDRLLTQVAQNLEDTPQMEPIRRALLEDALEFYQVFLQQKGRDPNIRFETGMAYFRVADIERQLGRMKECIQHYDEATKIYKDLAEEFPTRSEYREQLANCNLRHGTALTRLNRFKDAEAAYAKALAAWEDMVTERPGQPLCLAELARVNVELGRFWSHRYFHAKGNRYRQRADKLLTQLARDFPNYQVDPTVKLKVPDSLRATAQSRGELPATLRNRLKVNLWVLPHDPESLTRYEQEGREFLIHCEQRVEMHPDVPEYRAHFNQAAANFNRVLMAQGRFDEAERLAERQLVDIKRLVTEYPRVPDYRVNLAWNEFSSANLLYLAGQQLDAIEHYRFAIDTVGKLVEEYPDEPRYRTHLASMLIYCPAQQFQDGKRAEQILRRAQQITENPGEWTNLGRAQMLAGHYAEAMKSYARARELGVKNAQLYAGEALVYCHLGRLDEARKSYQKAVDWLETTPNKIWYLPEVRFVKKELEDLLRELETKKSADNKQQRQHTP